MISGTPNRSPCCTAEAIITTILRHEPVPSESTIRILGWMVKQQLESGILILTIETLKGGAQ